MNPEQFTQRLSGEEDPLLTPQEARSMAEMLLSYWGFGSDPETWERHRRHGLHLVRTLIVIAEGGEPRPLWKTYHINKQQDFLETLPEKC